MTDLTRIVADRQEIADQIYRYCRAMDRIDVELGYSVFHDDAIADYESFYQGSGRGFIDKVCAQHRQLLMHAHQISNIIVELDGDRAGSESYVRADLRMKRGDQLMQMSVWSRYVDQWSRRDGRWAIDKRMAVRDFDEVRAVTPMSETERATRDRGDPSYTVLR